jgi:hypothetical protein
MSSEVPGYQIRLQNGRNGLPLIFSFTNVTAFFIWGQAEGSRHSFEITIIPSSDEEPRTRILSDQVPDDFADRNTLHYVKGGLNRDTTYTVQFGNPFIGGDDNTVDFRYITFVDAVPKSVQVLRLRLIMIPMLRWLL